MSATIHFVEKGNIEIAENRQRRHFDEEALAKLSGGIQDKGLMHPIVVRRTFDDRYELVAGERRMKAIDMIYILGMQFKCGGVEVPLNHYPCVELSDLSDEEVMEAELEENILRENLTWQEEVTAKAMLHELRSRQAAARGERQTIKDTASEVIGKEAVGSAATNFAESLILANHLDDPEVQKAKSPKEAKKIIEKKAKKQHREVLAAAFDQEASAVGLDCPHVLKNKPMQDFITSMPPEHFAVIVTDPPYAVNANSFGSQVQVDHDYEDDADSVWPMMEVFARESFRVAEKQAHMYVFCDIRFFGKLKDMFEKEGWDVFDTPLIWFKSNGIGILPRPKHGPRRSYEAILYAVKGKRETNCVGLDVIPVPADTTREHGAQKPVALYSELLKRSALPGDRVADFFVGSGPIFPAAQENRCIAWGCELSPANFMIAQERINKMLGVEDVE